MKTKEKETRERAHVLWLILAVLIGGMGAAWALAGARTAKPERLELEPNAVGLSLIHL